MTIVTGDLTLPNQLTVQGWLAQFFSKSPTDYGLNTFQGQGSFEIEAPPADIFGFPEGKVTLTLSRFNEAITEVKDRKIQSITIEDGSGKSMQIVNGGVTTCHWGGAKVGHLVTRLGA